MDILSSVGHIWSCTPTTWLYAILVPILLIWFSGFLWQQYYERQKDPNLLQPLPPGSMGWPFFGETMQHLFGRYAGSERFFSKRQKQYKSDIVKTHLLGKPTIGVLGLEHTKRILQSEHTLVSHEWPDTVKLLLGPGAMSTMKGSVHKERRRIILSAFKPDTLETLVAPIRRMIQAAISRWLAEGRVVTLDEAKRLTFEMASHSLAGFSYNNDKELTDLINLFEEFISGLFSLKIDLPGFQFHKSKLARRALNEKLDKCIKRIQQSDGHDVTTVLSKILIAADDDAISDEDLMDEIILLLFAGYDTTACAITLCIMYCAKYPHIVDKIRDELIRHGLDDDVTPTYDVLARLRYINAFIREILMQEPPVGGSFMVALKSFEIGGYQVPAGWQVTYSIGRTHRMLFPANFDPDRWLSQKLNSGDAADEENDEKTSNESAPQTRGLLYFGIGSRSCVGKEFAKLFLRIFLLEFARTCDVTLENDTVKMKHFPMPKPIDGMPIFVKERKV